MLYTLYTVPVHAVHSSIVADTEGSGTKEPNFNLQVKGNKFKFNLKFSYLVAWPYNFNVRIRDY